MGTNDRQTERDEDINRKLLFPVPKTPHSGASNVGQEVEMTPWRTEDTLCRRKPKRAEDFLQTERTKVFRQAERNKDFGN